jgi:hypothetical protein
MHGAVNIAVVGNGDGLLSDAGDVLDELFNVAGAVQKGVIGVEMKMGEFRHGCCFYFRSRCREGPGGSQRRNEEKAGRNALVAERIRFLLNGDRVLWAIAEVFHG